MLIGFVTLSKMPDGSTQATPVSCVPYAYTGQSDGPSMTLTGRVSSTVTFYTGLRFDGSCRDAGWSEPWLAAYCRAISAQKLSDRPFNSDSFMHGYEAGRADAEDEIERLRRQVSELVDAAQVSTERLAVIDQIRRIVCPTEDETSADSGDWSDDE